MKLKILKVKNGAQYENRIYDFWIEAETLNKEKIKIFDHVPFDIRDKENQVIDVMLVVGFISLEDKKEGLQQIKGKLVDDVELNNDKWSDKIKDLQEIKWLGLENENDIFLVSEKEVVENGMKVGETVKLEVSRIDLVAIL
ncbi:MAG: hypothetical protein FWF46_01860 [Oscillospiraceae bacterium]|nr:hypothetical protein [Oscillospiraceae bacterium]